MFTLFYVCLCLCHVKSMICFQSYSSHRESITALYKTINEKGSLIDGLALNVRIEHKLKTIDTIRLVPLNVLVSNRSDHVFRFNVTLNKRQTNEEIKLIELRLKLDKRHNNDVRRSNMIFILGQFSLKRTIHPMMISTAQSLYHSYDLTRYLFPNCSQQWLFIRQRFGLVQRIEDASLIIYSRLSTGFLHSSTIHRRMTRSAPSMTFALGSCSKKDFFVDFDQLSFGTWVVEPKRFNAGLCHGDCPNPLSRAFYPTNHAMLLSLLHERGRTNQQPSCVPVRLRPLDLLYYDRRELVIKRHHGMQVEECGCR
jgi:hypothetical protein